MDEPAVVVSRVRITDRPASTDSPILTALKATFLTAVLAITIEIFAYVFAEASGNGNNERPDILLRNPRGFGRQIILDVAVTGIDGQSRTSDDLPYRLIS